MSELAEFGLGTVRVGLSAQIWSEIVQADRIRSGMYRGRLKMVESGLSRFGAVLK